MRGGLATKFICRCGFLNRRDSLCLRSLILVAVLVCPSSARAQQAVTSVAGCGKISKSGIYKLDSPSVTSIPGDCIIIAAANVALNLNGATITGAGIGAGAHAMSSAMDAFSEGRGAILSNFADGIEIDGPKVSGENFTVSANSDAGLLLKSATQAALSNFSADSNGNDGIRVVKGSYNILAGAVNATSNARYGLWLFATNNNDVGGFFVKDNAIAGVYVGCSSSGPLGAACKPVVSPGKYNSIFDGRVQASPASSQTYGAVVDAGDDSNRITNVTSPLAVRKSRSRRSEPGACTQRLVRPRPDLQLFAGRLYPLTGHSGIARRCRSALLEMT
jgi:hypothetical protein